MIQWTLIFHCSGKKERSEETVDSMARILPTALITKTTSLFGYPTQKYPWNSDTNPTQPIPKIWFGSGYYPWVPEFWVPNPHPSMYTFQQGSLQPLLQSRANSGSFSYRVSHEKKMFWLIKKIQMQNQKVLILLCKNILK